MSVLSSSTCTVCVISVESTAACVAICVFYVLNTKQ